MPDYRADELRPPSRRFDAELLERAIREAVADVSAPVARRAGRDARVRWGDQVDVRQLRTGRRARRDRGLPRQVRDQEHRAGRRAAAPDRAPTRSTSSTCASTCAATCAPRSTSTPPPPSSSARAAARAAGRARRRDRLEPGRARHPRAARDEHQRTATRPARTTAPCTPAASCGCSPTRRARRHDARARAGLRRSACTSPTSPRSARPRGRRRRHDRRDPRLAACAHAFGYRGHCLTKSRRYSTTFKALREAREAWVHAQILARSTDATQRAIAAATPKRAPRRSSSSAPVT